MSLRSRIVASFLPLGAVLGLVLSIAFLLPRVVHSQPSVQNQFVGATVAGGGLLTIYNGPPANKSLLTYIQKSYLTVDVNGVYYSNNPNGGLLGPSGASHPIDVSLFDDLTSKIRDTIRSVWKEKGFDIVQDVYPVKFTNSGVIVLSIKIVNHSSVALPAQAQFLLDNMNSDADSANDNPYLINRYGFIRNWQNCPPNPIPSFYLAFEHPPTEAKLGVVGIGYENDSFPPRPLGLIPLSQIQFGDWPDQINYTWGPAAITPTFTDEAALLISPANLANAYEPGGTDSVTEIMRTAYGTPEWCYDHGNVFGFALYPHHLYWDPASQTYTPNPFQVETFLFNVQPSAMSSTTISQTVGDPIRIVSPKPAGLPTTQAQTVPLVAPGGFVDFRWTDSAVVLQTGCAASFPVDLRFDVTANSVPQPVFFQPWDCSIDVECPNPDTIPPRFQNSFAGCDSVMRDTITARDNGVYDLGIDTITYSSPDFTSGQYSVTLNPATPYACIKTPVKIFVQQLDTFQSGHVIVAFTDCANNVSRDTLCFTAHLPIPDRTAPRFWNIASSDSCHAQCFAFILTDSAHSDTSIDRGLDSIVVVAAQNMMPPAWWGSTREWYPPNRFVDSLEVMCVKDSLEDGMIILRANDSTHNFSFDTIHYCTTPDKAPPALADTGFDRVNGSWHVHVGETRPWDRGVDSVWLGQASNVTTTPSLPVSLSCVPTFDLDVHVVDTTQCASAVVYTRDCAGNLDSIPFSFTKGAIPVIVASKTLLCSAADSAVLDAGAGYTGYLWSSGQTSEKITVSQGSYFVTVQEGAGCPATSNPIIVTLSPANPKIVPAGPIALCAPDSAQLDAGAGFATYQWLKDGATMPGMTSEKIWASSTGAYSVQVTNAAGCSGTSPAVTVTINPLPAQPVITAVNNVMTATDASPVVSYQWYHNGALLPGATSETYIDTSGSYTVTVTGANGCSNTSLPFSNSGSTVIQVAVSGDPQGSQLSIPLSVLASQGAPTGALGFTAKIAFNRTLLIPAPGSFTAMSVKGDSLIVTYQGTGAANPPGLLMNLPFTAALGDDSCTPVTIDSFAWNVPNIAVTVQNGSFCLTGLCYQGGTRLIDPNGKVTLSAAQPNPAHTSIQIGYSLIEQGRTTLVIYDVLGQEVLRLVDADLTPGTYTVKADVSTLPPGAYIYSLRTPSIVKSDHLQINR